MNSNKILVIEDNRDVNAMLVSALSRQGYAAESAYTGPEGVRAVRENKYDLLLLDIMLPYQSGDSVLQEVRCFSDVPVIVISAKDTVNTKVELLKLGADDYITKPFDLDEVVARVESNLRRSLKMEQSSRVLECRNLKLDQGRKQVTANGKELELTAKEYRILELLMENQDKVFTRENLYESIWNEAYLEDDTTVKTHLSCLRGKLREADPSESYIETVWGLGYRMRRG